MAKKTIVRNSKIARASKAKPIAKVLSSRLVFTSKVFSVREERVIEPRACNSDPRYYRAPGISCSPASIQRRAGFDDPAISP